MRRQFSSPFSGCQTDATPRREGPSHHLRRASASACSTAAIDAKSRFTASSSKPVPEPTVKTEFETVGEAADTDASAAEDVEARALEDPVEAADTDAAAAEEETCGETRMLGGPVEAASIDAAAAVEETCGEARTLGGPVEAAGTDVAAEHAPL